MLTCPTGIFLTPPASLIKCENVAFSVGSLSDDYRALYELPREDRNMLNSRVLVLCKRPEEVLLTFMVVRGVWIEGAQFECGW